MSTKPYTFQNLFNSSIPMGDEEITIHKIEIPIIQRDYAQGRKNEERVRTRFLDALFEAIVGDKGITLDFIYGDVTSDGVLIPLDGQQRLTTLFLLHWYIAKKEQIPAVEWEFLNQFSYATRFSSRDFCLELIKYEPDFNVEKLSPFIKDQPWYPYQWKNDSSIQGMLVMLDAIHKKFYNQTNLWDSLVTREKIKFYFLPLKEMGLTDELYIKMNSRGRPLTPFEHFKAEFSEVIKEVSSDLAKVINRKLDINWAEILFPWRNEDGIIDYSFMRYFHFISDIIAYEQDLPLEKDEFAEAKRLYSKENPDCKDNIKYLMDSFDCWENVSINVFFSEFFTNNKYENGKVKLYQENLNIFKECLDDYGEYRGRNRKFPLNKTILLFGIITYLKNKEQITQDEFRVRIRILRNLIWNSSDEIREERMKTLLNETKELILQGSIPMVERGDRGFAVRQKEEEQRKQNWLALNQDYANDLYRLEDHKLLHGSVAVIDLDTVDNFRKFRLLFHNCDKDSINRFLLSRGDYSQTIGYRVQLGSRNIESPWINLFHSSSQRSSFANTKTVLNEALASLDETELTNSFLELQIKSYLEDPLIPKDWRYYLIKYEEMRKGRFAMFYWENPEDKNYDLIMMNTEKSISGKNWNVFLRTLSVQPELRGKLELGDYAYQGDKLRILEANCEMECLNDRYVIHRDEESINYPILQENGIDQEDRVIKGKEIILSLLKEV